MSSINRFHRTSIPPQIELSGFSCSFCQKSVARDVQSVLRDKHVDLIFDIEVLQPQTHVKLKPNWKHLALTFSLLSFGSSTAPHRHEYYFKLLNSMSFQMNLLNSLF